MLPLHIITFHAEDDGAEQHKERHRDQVQDTVDRPLGRFILARQRPREPINHERHGQNGKIQRRIIVMHIGNSSHGHKWEIVQKPAGNRI